MSKGEVEASAGAAACAARGAVPSLSERYGWVRTAACVAGSAQALKWAVRPLAASGPVVRPDANQLWSSCCGASGYADRSSGARCPGTRTGEWEPWTRCTVAGCVLGRAKHLAGNAPPNRSFHVTAQSCALVCT